MKLNLDTDTRIIPFFEDHSICGTYTTYALAAEFFGKHNIFTVEDILRYNRKQLEPIGRSTIYRLEKALRKYDLTLLGSKLPKEQITAKQYKVALAHLLWNLEYPETSFETLIEADKQKYLKQAEEYTKEYIY